MVIFRQKPVCKDATVGGIYILESNDNIHPKKKNPFEDSSSEDSFDNPTSPCDSGRMNKSRSVSQQG